jgi:hypothetical protein
MLKQMRRRRLINIEQGLLDPPDDLSYRWRVLEDGCAEERRSDPLRSQSQNVGKVNRRNVYADQWRVSGMIVAAGGDHCRRAVVLDTSRVRVHAMMQLRRSTQRERPEKCRADANRNKRAPSVCWTRKRIHCTASL